MVMRHNGIEIDRSTRTIRHRERQYKVYASYENFSSKLKRYKLQVFEALIMGGGLSAAQLFWMIHGDDPEGGPLSGPQNLKVLFCQWRPAFDALDLELRRVKTAGVQFFSLVPKHRV